jgi:hypothetical protein
MHLPAAFVGASNLGMALGPLLSLPLAYLPDGRQVAGLPVNSITAVGWIMAAAWLAFLLATIAWFPEPPKRWVGQQQLRRSRYSRCMWSPISMPGAGSMLVWRQLPKHACMPARPSPLLLLAHNAGCPSGWHGSARCFPVREAQQAQQAE